MLNELAESQESSESILSIDLTFDVRTESDDGDELVHKKYTFGYAREWDKWVFQEYAEKRTKNGRTGDRNWRQSRHILWHDVSETPTIDVPPEVTEKLKEATGAETVVIQPP